MLLFCCPVEGAYAGQGPDLFAAVAEGHRAGEEQLGVAAVKAALKAGANVNTRDNAGWTPLMAAAQEGLPRVLSVLLKAGADVNARSADGDTALMVAAGCFIVRRRAEMAQQRHLPDAVRVENLAAPATMAQALLNAGAAVNAQRKDGRTALMDAVMMGWPKVVQMLVAAKAGVNTRDAEGRLAIDYVDRASYPEIAQMLFRAGSKAPTGRSGRSVCDAQAQLLKLGYDIGAVDCIAGKQFAAAVVAFQKKNGLEASGTLDAETRQALHIR